jgi:hypothetical protein
MKIVYIPQHLYPALKKANLRSQELRDVEKLLNTLSAEDVAFYFYANDSRHCPIPKDVKEALPNHIFGPTEVTPFTDSDQSKNVLGKFNSFILNGVSADIYETNAIFTTDCEEEDLIIVTHTTPADDEVDDKASTRETAFYDRIIQQLLAFDKLETVMASPILLGWMKSVQTSA